MGHAGHGCSLNLTGGGTSGVWSRSVPAGSLPHWAGLKGPEAEEDRRSMTLS